MFINSPNHMDKGNKTNLMRFSSYFTLYSKLVNPVVKKEEEYRRDKKQVTAPPSREGFTFKSHSFVLLPSVGI